MKFSDDIVEQFAKDLATRTSNQLFYEYGKALEMDSPVFSDLVYKCYFILLNQVEELICTSMVNCPNKALVCPVEKILKGVLSDVFFDEPRLYRVMHQAVSSSMPFWDDLSGLQKRKFKQMYKRTSFIAWCAIIYWTGGWTDKETFKTLEQLL